MISFDRRHINTNIKLYQSMIIGAHLNRRQKISKLAEKKNPAVQQIQDDHFPAPPAEEKPKPPQPLPGPAPAAVGGAAAVPLATQTIITNLNTQITNLNTQVTQLTTQLAAGGAAPVAKQLGYHNISLQQDITEYIKQERATNRPDDDIYWGLIDNVQGIPEDIVRGELGMKQAPPKPAPAASGGLKSSPTGGPAVGGAAGQGGGGAVAVGGPTIGDIFVGPTGYFFEVTRYGGPSGIEVTVFDPSGLKVATKHSIDKNELMTYKPLTVQTLPTPPKPGAAAAAALPPTQPTAQLAAGGDPATQPSPALPTSATQLVHGTASVSLQASGGGDPDVPPTSVLKPWLKGTTTKFDMWIDNNPKYAGKKQTEKKWKEFVAEQTPPTSAGSVSQTSEESPSLEVTESAVALPRQKPTSATPEEKAQPTAAEKLVGEQANAERASLKILIAGGFAGRTDNPPQYIKDALSKHGGTINDWANISEEAGEELIKRIEHKHGRDLQDSLDRIIWRDRYRKQSKTSEKYKKQKKEHELRQLKLHKEQVATNMEKVGKKDPRYAKWLKEMNELAKQIKHKQGQKKKKRSPPKLKPLSELLGKPKKGPGGDGTI